MAAMRRLTGPGCFIMMGLRMLERLSADQSYCILQVNGVCRFDTIHKSQIGPARNSANFEYN